MKYQTNPELGPYINHWGCFFCSILEKAEKSTGWTKHFSNDDVVKIYRECMGRGMIGPEKTDVNGHPIDGCFVFDAPGVYNRAVVFLGGKSECIGYKKVGNDYIPDEKEEEILCLARSGYNGKHFVSGTGKNDDLPDEIEFDPIEGGSNCARLGWIDSKRILTIA